MVIVGSSAAAAQIASLVVDKAISMFLDILIEKHGEVFDDLIIYPIRNYKSWVSVDRGVIVKGKQGLYLDLKLDLNRNPERVLVLTKETLFDLQLTQPSWWAKFNVNDLKQFVTFNVKSGKTTMPYQSFVEIGGQPTVTASSEATMQLYKLLEEIA